MIYHLAYRVGDGKRQHIYATKQICEKKRKNLIAEHGKKIKFSRIEIA